MIIQYFRNALSFFGAIIFVFGGLFLVDQYSGWRPFEGQLATAEINRSAGAAFPKSEGGPDGHQVSSDFTASPNEIFTRQDRFDAKTEHDSPMRRGRQSSIVE